MDDLHQILPRAIAFPEKQCKSGIYNHFNRLSDATSDVFRRSTIPNIVLLCLHTALPHCWTQKRSEARMESLDIFSVGFTELILDSSMYLGVVHGISRALVPVAFPGEAPPIPVRPGQPHCRAVIEVRPALIAVTSRLPTMSGKCRRQCRPKRPSRQLAVIFHGAPNFGLACALERS